MAELARSRRSALKAIGLLLAGVAGLWRFLTPRPGPSGGVARPTVSVADGEIPENGAIVLPQFGVALVRADQKLLALDLACTHLGCTVAATENGFACPCHGSRFSPTGAVLAGPAPRPLGQLEVNVSNGVVRVFRDGGVNETRRHRADPGFESGASG